MRENPFSQQPTTGNLYHRSCSIPPPLLSFDYDPVPHHLVTRLREAHLCAFTREKWRFLNGLAQKRLQNPRIFLLYIRNNAILSARRESHTRIFVYPFARFQDKVSRPSNPPLLPEEAGLRYSDFLLVIQSDITRQRRTDNEDSVARSGRAEGLVSACVCV